MLSLPPPRSSQPLSSADREVDGESFGHARDPATLGRIVYDLKGDFGVGPDELRERFAFYFESFGVRAE